MINPVGIDVDPTKIDKQDSKVVLIYQAIRALSGRDDGAKAKDSTGFNKFDTVFGQSLADKPYDMWSINMFAYAYRMLKKYRAQLMRDHQIDFNKMAIVIDPDDLKAIKDRGGYKPTQRPQGTAITSIPQQQQYPVREEPVRDISIDETTKEIVLLFKHMDRSEWNKIYTAVKDAGARFNSDDKTWRFSFTQNDAMAVAEIAQTFEFAATEEDQERIGSIARQGEILEEASKAHEAEFEVDGLGGTLRPFQKAGVKFIWMTHRAIVADDMGLGKWEPVDALILTPHGWQTIGSVKIGDQIIGSNGKTTNITGVYPQGVKDAYRVTFSDGSSVEAGLEHLWTVRYWKGGRHLEELVLTTEQLMNRPKITLEHNDPYHPRTTIDLSKTRLYLPMLTAPVEFDKQSDLPIPPYTLGQMISNGALSYTPRITCNKNDEQNLRRNMEQDGVSINEITQHGNIFKFTISDMTQKIKFLGLNILSKDKFIPEEYLMASPEDRISLLHGLMDGDGSISSTGNRLSYHTTSHQLALDFVELVEGLGGIASINTYDRTHEDKPVEYRIRLRLPHWVVPFTIDRKLDKYYPGRSAFPVRTVLSVEFTRQAEGVCIAVDAPDKLYVTEHCILTHNTIEAIASLQALSAFPALVVCPASLKFNWLREVEKWLPGVRAFIIKGKITGSELSITDPEICITNYESLKKNLDALAFHPWKAVVFDEAHRLKTANAQRSQAAMSISYRTNEEVDWREKKDFELNAIPIRLALTGTPVQNRPAELLNLLKIIGRVKDISPKGITAFLKRYCGTYDGYSGYKGADNTQELHTTLRRTCMIRRMKAEVLTELPEIIRSIITFEINNRAEYEKAEADIIAWVGKEAERKALEDKKFMESIKDLTPDEQLQAITDRKISAEERAARAEQLVRIEKLKTIAAKGKLPQVKEWMEDFLDSDEKLIVFANHIEIQKDIAKMFPGCAILAGGEKSEVIQENKDRFQNDPDCKLIVCSLIAGGEGHTLTAASNVAHTELGWTPSSHDQAVSRAHRMGQKASSVTEWYFIAKDTIEEEIASLLDAKRKVVNAVTDGREMDASESLMEGVWDYLKKKAKAKE